LVSTSRRDTTDDRHGTSSTSSYVSASGGQALSYMRLMRGYLVYENGRSRMASNSVSYSPQRLQIRRHTSGETSPLSLRSISRSRIGQRAESVFVCNASTSFSSML